LAIDASLLLSTSPFEGDWPASSMTKDWLCPMYEFDDKGVIYWGMHDKPAMQQFRQIRATLRRVCQSWKNFVDSPYIEHRCMRFCIPSTSNEEPDINQLVLARRIEVVSPPDGTQHLEGALQQAIAKGRRFNAEILLDIGGSLVGQIFPKHIAAFPFLTSLVVDFQNRSPLPLPSIKPEIQLPDFVSLTTLVLRLEGFYSEFPDHKIFRIPNLCSLSISGKHRLPVLDFSKWRLASLRNLELVGIFEIEQFTQFFTYLYRFSLHLRYLRLVPYPSNFISKVPIHHLWGCRKLERLEMPLHLLFLYSNQAQNLSQLRHIVHTGDRSLVTVGHDWGSFDFMKFYGAFIGFCLELRALKTVTDSHRWSATLKQANTPLEELDGKGRQTSQYIHNSASAATVILARKLHNINMRYEDKEHKTLAEARARVGLT
jgi:hypothetical protein